MRGFGNQIVVYGHEEAIDISRKQGVRTTGGLLDQGTGLLQPRPMLAVGAQLHHLPSEAPAHCSLKSDGSSADQTHVWVEDPTMCAAVYRGDRDHVWRMCQGDPRSAAQAPGILAAPKTVMGARFMQNIAVNSSGLPGEYV